MKSKPFDVFISFSSGDAETAVVLKEGLTRRGLRCWKAPDDLLPGESWPAGITRALANSTSMVLIWSAHSIQSAEVSKELTLAMNGKLTVVPYRIEEIPPSPEWAYHLSNIHWHDAFSLSSDESISALADRLIGLLKSGRNVSPGSTDSILSRESLRPCLVEVMRSSLEGIVEEFENHTRLFTPLRMNHRGGIGGFQKQAVPLMSLDRLVKARQSVGAGSDGINLDNFFKPNGRWIVTGLPGCGKSTTMRVLASRMASEALEALRNEAKPRKRCPVFLELGRYEQGALLSNSLARESLGRFAKQSISDADFRDFLSGCEIIWIMDGLDEGMIGCSQVNDSPLWREIEILMAQRPGDTFIISTRASHLPAGSRFETVEIKSLGREEAVTFMAKYLELFEVPENAETIYAAVPQSLREVATTPLVLSMVVSAFLQNSAVPGTLDELYKSYVAMTLEEVEVARGGKTPPEVKDLSLAALAFEMLTSSRPVLKTAEAIEVIGRRLSSLSGSGVKTSGVDSSQVFDELLYSGLLVKQDYQVSYLHLTLMEYFAACEMRREYNFTAQAEMDQYFLRNAEKIRLILKSAAITLEDHLIEVGAGIGSVAKHFPPAKSLTLIDLDPDLIKILRYQFSEVTVLEVDALKALKELPCDILVSNLPFFLTEGILTILSEKQFKRAVMSVHFDDQFEMFEEKLKFSTLSVLEEDDFFPRQPFKSKLILVEPRQVPLVLNKGPVTRIDLS
jgi:TIR domain/Ribosomal RNA adenine dimethylase